MDDQPVALVTGSSRGIGKGIAQHFLNQGYRVVGCSRGPATLDQEGYEHSTVDICDAQQVRGWIRGVGQSHGHIDVVVNNAGIFPQASLVPVTPVELVESTFRTNYLGTFLVCQEAAKLMLRRRFGRIINISSIVVGLRMPGVSAYSASKSAVEQFSKVLAKELIPYGVTSNVVAVSLVESDITEQLTDEVIAQYKQGLAIGRWAGINDVCSVVSFFAGANNGHVTGQIIHLDYVD